ESLLPHPREGRFGAPENDAQMARVVPLDRRNARLLNSQMSTPTDNLRDQIQKLTPAQRALFEQRLREQRAERISGYSIVRRADAEAAPLSFAQQRLWFLDQLAPGSPAYNMGRAYRIRGRLREDLLRRALAAVVARHEALRTTFSVVDGRAVQGVHADMEVEWTFRDVSGGREDSVQHD